MAFNFYKMDPWTLGKYEAYDIFGGPRMMIEFFSGEFLAE